MENIDIDKYILENIDIVIDIDKEILENIDIDIDMDKEILENIDIDKILNRLEFGISNRASHHSFISQHWRWLATCGENQQEFLAMKVFYWSLSCFLSAAPPPHVWNFGTSPCGFSPLLCGPLV